MDRPARVEWDYRREAREVGHDLLMQALKRGYLAGDRVADDNRRPEDDLRHPATTG